MAEYIEIGQLWNCETCYHNDIYGCTLGLGCDHGENYRPAYSKLKKADVAPVVHSYWRHGNCASCGLYVGATTSRFFNYCPNCGARMDGE